MLKALPVFGIQELLVAVRIAIVAEPVATATTL